jgi:hypothetical protein
MNADTINEASFELGVDKSILTGLNETYANLLLPIINRRYLSHLVSTLEDLIAAKRKKSGNQCWSYKIILRPGILKKRATTRFFACGAEIFYNANLIGKQAHLLIAHELGHVVNKDLLEIENSEANANAFAFVAINDKNEFYLSKCKEFTFKGREKEIIAEIKNVCR